MSSHPMAFRVPIRILTVLVALGSGAAQAQLSREQKLHDFQNLAAVYAKRYAPYEWKKQLFNYDLFDLAGWLQRVEGSRDDLEFFEICSEYVARLDDIHVTFRNPSTFTADSGVRVDIYDDKVLIDAINRTALPAGLFPLQVGDELVSVDGVDVERLIGQFTRLLKRANPRTTRRIVSDYLTFRPQSLFPRAVELGDTARMEIRRQDGTLETYTIPWAKSGFPIRAIGPVPTPSGRPPVKTGAKTFGFGLPSTLSEEPPDYLRPLVDLGWSFVSNLEEYGVLGWGSRTPVFALPPNFVQRLGRMPTDFHLSGTYEAGGMRLGYIRIPNFSPPNTANALREMETEVAFFEQNTDGLVVDVTRNTGGLICYGLETLRRLIPQRFTYLGFELRATLNWLNGFQASLDAARRARADQWIIDLYSNYVAQIRDSYENNRGRTGPLPLCGLSFEYEPARSPTGALIAYSKPTIMLIDEFSTSTGDMVPAAFQDNRRGPLVGWRTTGAGGSVIGWTSGLYSEASASNTESLAVRSRPYSVPGYPTSHYIENVGVHPDIQLDYMTRENLLNRGSVFVADFTGVIVSHLLDSRR